jgi:hypothetical protein
MSMILSWVVFPLAMAAVGLGWGTLVEAVAGRRVNDALLIPLGLAAALVVAGTTTAFSAIAPATVTVTGVGTVAGLVLAAVRRRTISPWPALIAIAVLIAYGAPVLLSGEATFTGVVKLDDTATWFNFIDNVISHGRSTSGLAPSTYRLQLEANPAYPLGAFMLPGAIRGLTGIDVAWIFQPYLAACGAAVSMCLYALIEPVLKSRRLRALVAFLGAQSALLYGYSQWSGIKELTAAFLLVLGMALAADLFTRPRARARELVPVAVATGGLLQTLSIGAGGWMAPAVAFLLAAWLVPRIVGRESLEDDQAALTPRERRRAAVISFAWLTGLSAVCIIPIWTVIAKFVNEQDTNLFTEGQNVHTKLGNLYAPLKAAQLAGIWLEGDFRVSVSLISWTSLFIVIELVAAVGALWWTLRRRQFALALYVIVALLGCAIFYLGGSTPWVTAKSLAIASPALLTAALVGGAALWESRRQAGEGEASSGGRAAWAMRHGWLLGALTTVVIGAGVLWSNILAYGDVSLASRPRMEELQHIGKLVAGKGPTLVNEYEVYADRHFLREGAPTEPAEYREATLALRTGAVLTKAADADIDSFPLETLLPYRSIVTPRSPTESRPPSIWALVYQGRYYDLWQRPEPAPSTIIEHIPYGESNSRPYCGSSENQESKPLCSLDPVTIPSCPQVEEFGRRAAADHAHLLAYEAPEPTVVRGDEVLWPGYWYHENESHSLIPTAPGTATGHIRVPSSQRYEVWLGGSFSRGMEVRVDGEKVGVAKDELAGFTPAYVPVGSIYLSAGVHTFTYTYQGANLTPGSAEDTLSELTSVELEPLEYPRAKAVSVAPAQAKSICPHTVDWIEIVAGPA